MRNTRKILKTICMIVSGFLLVVVLTKISMHFYHKGKTTRYLVLLVYRDHRSFVRCDQGGNLQVVDGRVKLVPCSKEEAENANQWKLDVERAIQEKHKKDPVIDAYARHPMVIFLYNPATTLSHEISLQEAEGLRVTRGGDSSPVLRAGVKGAIGSAGWVRQTDDGILSPDGYAITRPWQYFPFPSNPNKVKKPHFPPPNPCNTFAFMIGGKEVVCPVPKTFNDQTQTEWDGPIFLAWVL